MVYNDVWYRVPFTVTIVLKTSIRVCFQNIVDMNDWKREPNLCTFIFQTIKIDFQNVFQAR